MQFVYDYYFEIKNRFSLLLLTLFSTLVICYLYKEVLLFIIVKPSTFFFRENFFYFIFTDVTEIFSVYFSIVLFTAKQVTFIYMLYHFLTFLVPSS